MTFLKQGIVALVASVRPSLSLTDAPSVAQLQIVAGISARMCTVGTGQSGQLNVLPHVVFSSSYFFCTGGRRKTLSPRRKDVDTGVLFLLLLGTHFDVGVKF